MAPEDDHQCPWRDEAKRLADEVEELKQKFASLERRLLGPKTEKMPPMAGEVRKQRPPSSDDAQKRRAENVRAREKLETEIVPVPVPEVERSCPKCVRISVVPDHPFRSDPITDSGQTRSPVSVDPIAHFGPLDR